MKWDWRIVGLLFFLAIANMTASLVVIAIMEAGYKNGAYSNTVRILYDGIAIASALVSWFSLARYLLRHIYTAISDLNKANAE